MAEKITVECPWHLGPVKVEPINNNLCSRENYKRECPECNKIFFIPPGRPVLSDELREYFNKVKSGKIAEAPLFD